MNITFALPAGADLGGVTAWSVEMARRLAAAGQAACLLEHVDPTADHEIQAPPGVRLVQHRGRLPTHVQLSDVRQYVPAYLDVLPSLMIPNYSWGTYAACAAVARKQARQSRVIGFAHTDEVYYYDLLGYYEPIIHLFVAVSREVAEALGNRLPHRRRDIMIRPYGVEVAGSLSRTYSPPQNPIQLVYAGRLVESQKRVSHLIALAETLAQRQVNFCLRIIGEGEEKDNLLHSAQRLDRSTSDCIRFEDRIQHHQMLEVWRSADICVLVSEYEGTSIAMLEAMACGCVPVVTHVSGTSAVIAPGENGYFVDVGDVATMARVIQKLAAERDKVGQLGINAHRTVRDRFSFPAYVDWFLSAANQAWERPPRPWPATRTLLPPGAILGSAWNSVRIALLTPVWKMRGLSRHILKRIALRVRGEGK